MAVQITSDSPLYQVIYPQVQSKVAEYEWSNADDTSLTDFILLNLANGKTQDELSKEIEDLLDESDYDKLPIFTGWLFGQIQAASGQSAHSAADPRFQHPPGADPSTAQSLQQDVMTGDSTPMLADQEGLDEEMNEVPTGPANGAMQVAQSIPVNRKNTDCANRPSGPKSMRSGNLPGRGGRGSRGINGHGDSTLHRIRGTATSAGRINTHQPPRGPTPRGPRGALGASRGGRGGSMNNVNVQAVQQAVQAPTGVKPLTPEQQNYVNNMMTENMMTLATMFMQQQQSTQSGAGFGMGGAGRGNYHGRSLFDRVEGRNGRGNRPSHKQQQQQQNGEANGDNIELTSSMEVENDSQSQRQDARNTLCRFNLLCTKPDCGFAHQSPAAPPGTEVDMNDECKYGANCKNKKCAGKHPSPARTALQQEAPICKYYPNCTNPYCMFQHPQVPPCRNGADCATPNCPFGHNMTPCKFNPCTNPSCQFKHQEGQKQVVDRATAFKKSSWVRPDLRSGEEEGDHLSERKFVDQNVNEEVIIPGAASSQQGGMETAEATEVA